LGGTRCMEAIKILGLIPIAAATAGLTYNGISAILGPDTLEAAQRENEALKARREALREEAFVLGARASELLERGRLLAPSSEVDRGWRATSLAPPASSASNEQIISWISSEGAQLESLAVELSSGHESPTLEPEPRDRVRPGVDPEMKQVRDLELPSDMNTDIAERQLRQTGDSS